MKQTAVEYIVNQISEILGPIKTEVMQDLLIVDAIKKAKEIEREQIEDAYFTGEWPNSKSITREMVKDNASAYYNITYKK